MFPRAFLERAQGPVSDPWPEPAPELGRGLELPLCVPRTERLCQALEQLEPTQAQVSPRLALGQLWATLGSETGS